jgi:hypothetical protein
VKSALPLHKTKIIERSSVGHDGLRSYASAGRNQVVGLNLWNKAPERATK